MRLYCGIDLHSNNAYVVIVDEEDRRVFRKRLPNDLSVILAALRPHAERLAGIAVESTFNWYWLVDGLIDAGYRVHLANPAAMKQYEGIKHGDDQTDAWWLAQQLRLGVLPEGYIYPRESRGLRDLLRRRGRLVQQRTANLLSLKGTLHRNTGQRLTGRALKDLQLESLDALLTDDNVKLATAASWRLIHALDEEIRLLEQEAQRQIKPDPTFKRLKTIAGVGEVLASTIRLETGEIHRFRSAGRYVSYCRGVGSARLSNGKVKGRGNTKNGNRHLAWAWMEAANFAIIHHPPVRRYYDRKKARTHRVVALKAIAHKLARAGFYVMRDEQPFRMEMAFG